MPNNRYLEIPSTHVPHRPADCGSVLPGQGQHAVGLVLFAIGKFTQTLATLVTPEMWQLKDCPQDSRGGSDVSFVYYHEQTVL